MSKIKNALKRLFPYAYYRYSLFSIEKKFNSASKNIEEEVIKRYKKIFGRVLDLQNPKTFYEKVNYLKLHFDSDVSFLVDKILVKDYLKANYPNIKYAKTLKVFNSFNDFRACLKNRLIPDPCVIKLNHTSGDIFIYKNGKWIDKYGFEITKRCVLACLKYRTKLNFFHAQFEKVYDNLIPKIFAEEYLDTDSNFGLDEYKLFCNYGLPKMINVVYGRQKQDGVKEAFTDIKLTPFPVSQGQKILSEKEIYHPPYFEEMIDFAKEVSKPFPLLRVDLFAKDNTFVFCEFTFYDLAGNGIFYPDEYNEIIGDLFTIK